MTRMLTSPRAQRGVTLVVGLIMLVLITLVITSAFMLSTSNLRAVGNMQFRDEAIAAANAAIETALSAASLSATNTTVDIGGIEYDVEIKTPICVRANLADAGVLTSLSLPLTLSSGNTWNALFDIEAVVDDPRSSARVSVHQGVRTLLTQAQRDALCS